MSDPGDSPQPINVRAYTVAATGAGLAATALLVGLAAAGQVDKMVAVFGSWIVWLPIVIGSGTRRLWDSGFTGGRVARIRSFLTDWVGLTGIATAVVVVVLWITLSPCGIHPRGGYWLIPEIAVPVVMLARRGVVRRIGAGLAMVLAAPLWPFVLIGVLVLLGPPFLVYLVTVAISQVFERNRVRR